MRRRLCTERTLASAGRRRGVLALLLAVMVLLAGCRAGWLDYRLICGEADTCFPATGAEGEL